MPETDPPANPGDPKPVRRWVVPPAPSPTDDGFAGLDLLRECPDDLGVLLWLGARNVLLWAEVPAHQRGELFAPTARVRYAALAACAGADEALPAPFSVLESLLDADAREEPDTVAAASAEIAAWATTRGWSHTALVFADAAARVQPRCGAAARHVGELARHFGRHQVADAWLRRAVALARRAQDWEVDAGARIELGRLAVLHDRPAAARRHFLKALRRARRHGLASARAAAAGGLLHLALAARDAAAVERYRRAAMRNLARTDPERLRLALQVSDFWIECGPVERAAAPLREILGSSAGTDLRFRAAVLLARAAARQSDPTMMDEAWQHASGLLTEQGDTPETARALLSLARSTVDALERGRQESAAYQALDLGRRLGDEAIQNEAAELLGRRHVPPPPEDSSRPLRQRS